MKTHVEENHVIEERRNVPGLIKIKIEDPGSEEEEEVPSPWEHFNDHGVDKMEEEDEDYEEDYEDSWEHVNQELLEPQVQIEEIMDYEELLVVT